MTAPIYAKGTEVPIEKTKAEIDTLLGRHGAAQRGVLHDEERGLACVVFSLRSLRYKIEVPLPTAREASAAAQRTRRTERAQLEQMVRERWRGLLLLLKAKLEIVRMGASTFEREFLADLILPNGDSAGVAIGQYMKRLIAEGYRGPLQLPEPGERGDR